MVPGSPSPGQGRLEQLLSGCVDEAGLRLALAGQGWVHGGRRVGWGLHVPWPSVCGDVLCLQSCGSRPHLTSLVLSCHRV